MLAFNEQKKDVAFEVPSLALTACDVLIVHDLLSLHVSRFLVYGINLLALKEVTKSQMSQKRK